MDKGKRKDGLAFEKHGVEISMPIRKVFHRIFIVITSIGLSIIFLSSVETGLCRLPQIIYIFKVSQQKIQMSKTQASVELCKVPESVKFLFQEEQEMNSSITLQNLRDNVVSFKIKTNKPGIYLVKPMEGQILSKNNVSIAFKRKQLTLDNFNAIQNNPGQGRQKFLIEFSCDVQDSVGITQKLQQVAYLGVSFTRSQDSPTKAPPAFREEEKPKRQRPMGKPMEKKADLSMVATQKRQQLQKLIVERQTLQAKSAGKGTTTFSMMDLINVLVLAFLAGLVIV